MIEMKKNENCNEESWEPIVKADSFSSSNMIELVIHLEALYSNDREFGTEVRRLLSVNKYLSYKNHGPNAGRKRK